MITNTLYDIGETLYLKTDKEQLPRLCTSIRIFPGNLQAYELAEGIHFSFHYEMEISKEKNLSFLMKTEL